MGNLHTWLFTMPRPGLGDGQGWTVVLVHRARPGHEAAHIQLASHAGKAENQENVGVHFLRVRNEGREGAL